MAKAFTPGLTVSHAVRIKKVRELPLPGKILFAEGSTVKSSDIVAQTELPGDLHIVRVPEKLGIEPHEAVRVLRISVGDSVVSSQLLAEHSAFFGIFKSQCIAPVDGTVEFITERTGHVGIRMASKPVTVDAYISGIVTAIVPGKSITIETSGSLVQGIFGVGGERCGVLQRIHVANNKSLEKTDIPADCSGKVLFGGTSPTAEVLQYASFLGARALIVGSVDDTALKAYVGYDIGIALTGDEPIAMSLIITEGFGNLALADRVTKILSDCEGQIASVNGATQVRAGALRPEVIISNYKGTQQTQQAEHGLGIGSRIRLIRVPYFGLTATVTELPTAMHTIETGAHARVLRAKLDDGKEVIVPRANVELVS